MIFHDLGLPKTHPKSISKSIPKTKRFWTLSEPYVGSLLASRWLLHGFQSCQDGSKTTQGAAKTPLICRQSRPSTSQDASKTAQDAPKALEEPPRRLSEPPRALQRRVLRPQAVSKSSLEELPKPPAFALPPLASGLQVASAGSAKRKFAVPSGVLDPQCFASSLVNLLSSSNLRFLGPKILDLRCI